ncbi:hypothetical protein C0991_011686, partial [Blastosporella zonata]
HEAAKPAVVARSVTETATGVATSTGTGAPAPTEHKAGNGTHKEHKPHVVTKTGTDGKATVTVFEKGTSTKCFAPTATPGAKGTGKSSHKADEQTPAAKPDAAKVVARSVTPVAHATGAATTTTVTYNPRPTACKAGEPVTWHGKSKKSGAEHSGAKHEAAKPAVVARSVTETATGTATSTGTGAPAPTEHKAGNGTHKEHKPHVVTKTGTDGKATVTVFEKGTSTKCFAPTATPGAKGAEKSSHKGDSTHPADQVPVSGAKKDNTASVVARAIDLLERYFGDLDELD